MYLPTLYEYYTSGGITTGLSANHPYFTLNHKNITIYSGSLHYFRVHPEYWSDRLRKMRAAGLNTVETYIPWNLHEPNPKKFDFGKGGSDFEKFLNIELFLKTAQKEDLFAIVRPGPYICAEWEFGGLPSWLLRTKNIQIRTSKSAFIKYVDRYFKVLMSVLTLLQFTKSGPIIAFQIENEYGSLKRRDMKYLKRIKRIIKKYGACELLFTSDGPSAGNLGHMPGILFTGNFQSDPETELKTLKKYQPKKPLMVMEYWSGWFDHWGEGHVQVKYSDFCSILEIILNFPASVNLYMFHGGTSFGFMNGANLGTRGSDNEGFQPDTTSYDYDAPLSENGDYTRKYFCTKKLIKKYNKIPTYLPEMPSPNPRKSYHTIKIKSQLTLNQLINQIPYRILSPVTIPMELLPINNNSGQSYGYIIYRKINLNIPKGSILKIIGRVCDTLMVLINGILKSKILESKYDFNGFGYWRQKNSSLKIDREYLNATLDLVVENWGRVNFGTLKQFLQYKGLWQGPILLNQIQIENWTVIPLEFKSKWIQGLNNWNQLSDRIGPSLYKAELIIFDDPMDTYVDMRDWIKGVVIVNGFVLSRYLKLGPQQAAYLPAPFLHKGVNEILIFEHFERDDYVKFLSDQLYENKQEIYRKTVSIYMDDMI